MMLHIEVCFPLLQAMAQIASQFVSNASTLHATYLSDTATKTSSPLLRIYLCGICQIPLEIPLM